MSKKRGLGKGLDALLSDARSVSSVTEVDESDHQDLDRLAVDRIRRGRYQPRRHFDPDALQELADSIAAQGMVQPVVVRPAEDGGYELIAGERRWRAAQIAGLHEIPAVIRDLDEQAAAAVSLIENIQREDLNPLEEARAIGRLVEDFGLTHQQVAAQVGRSRAAVSNLLRLQELDEVVKELVETGQLEMGHARALLALQGERQRAVAQQVAERGLTVRATEDLVRRELEGSGAATRAAKPAAKDPDTRQLEQELSEKLGADVTLRAGKNGSGRLQIAYNSLDELEGILAHIR